MGLMLNNRTNSSCEFKQINCNTWILRLDSSMEFEAMVDLEPTSPRYRERAEIRTSVRNVDRNDVSVNRWLFFSWVNTLDKCLQPIQKVLAWNRYAADSRSSLFITLKSFKQPILEFATPLDLLDLELLGSVYFLRRMARAFRNARSGNSWGLDRCNSFLGRWWRCDRRINDSKRCGVFHGIDGRVLDQEILARVWNPIGHQWEILQALKTITLERI